MIVKFISIKKPIINYYNQTLNYTALITLINTAFTLSTLIRAETHPEHYSPLSHEVPDLSPETSALNYGFGIIRRV